jgi:hypothetical protein
MKFYPRIAQEILLAHKGIRVDPKPKPEIQINFVKDDFFMENEENFYYLDNPFCYISILLYKKGPLISNSIWNEYLKDKERGFEYDVIDSIYWPFRTPRNPFPNIPLGKHYLKKKYIKRMLTKDHIHKAGYSKTQMKWLGYSVNPKVAFQWVIFPPKRSIGPPSVATGIRPLAWLWIGAPLRADERAILRRAWGEEPRGLPGGDPYGSCSRKWDFEKILRA